MAQLQNKQATGRLNGRVKSWLTLSLKIGLFLFVSVSLLASLSLEKIMRLDHFLADVSVGFLLLRCAVFLALMVYWKKLIAWLAHKNQWSKAHHLRVINNRWQVIALFIVLELLFNHRTYLSLLGM